MIAKKYVVISCSLDGEGRTRSLATIATCCLRRSSATVQLIDMKDAPIPPFDNNRIFEDQNFMALYRAISSADGIVIASPIYNWSLGSVVKQVIEATGATGENGRRAAWFDKIVTFICAGGLPHSYTAYASFAMSLMLDYKCIINPYVVYATERDWMDQERLCQPLKERMDKALLVKTELVQGLTNRSYRSDWEI